MKHYIGPSNPMRQQFDALASYSAQHFSYAFDAGVVTLTLNRPERKNPLTFDSYHELRNLFAGLNHSTDVKAVVLGMSWAPCSSTAAPRKRPISKKWFGDIGYIINNHIAT